MTKKSLMTDIIKYCLVNSLYEVTKKSIVFYYNLTKADGPMLCSYWEFISVLLIIWILTLLSIDVNLLDLFIYKI